MMQTSGPQSEAVMALMTLRPLTLDPRNDNGAARPQICLCQSLAHVGHVILSGRTLTVRHTVAHWRPL